MTDVRFAQPGLTTPNAPLSKPDVVGHFASNFGTAAAFTSKANIPKDQIYLFENNRQIRYGFNYSTTDPTTVATELPYTTQSGAWDNWIFKPAGAELWIVQTGNGNVGSWSIWDIRTVDQGVVTITGPSSLERKDADADGNLTYEIEVALSGIDPQEDVNVTLTDSAATAATVVFSSDDSAFTAATGVVALSSAVRSVPVTVTIDADSTEGAGLSSVTVTGTVASTSHMYQDVTGNGNGPTLETTLNAVKALTVSASAATSWEVSDPPRTVTGTINRASHADVWLFAVPDDEVTIRDGLGTWPRPVVVKAGSTTGTFQIDPAAVGTPDISFATESRDPDYHGITVSDLSLTVVARAARTVTNGNTALSVTASGNGTGTITLTLSHSPQYENVRVRATSSDTDVATVTPRLGVVEVGDNSLTIVYTVTAQGSANETCTVSFEIRGNDADYASVSVASTAVTLT